MFKSYAAAYQYLRCCTDYEKMAKFNYSQSTFNIQRMKRFLDCVGNPHHDLSTLHIAGTKGKGSTAIILASLLKKAGYQVGLFTSPHVVDLMDRIQINGVTISKRDFTRTMNRFSPYLKQLKPTFFEIMTAMALLYFREQSVDWAIMEVGLGGRLDATNVITPAVSIITRIDFDHMDKLGHTLTAIAGEKAGIIKPGIPVVTIQQDAQVNEVFRKKALSQKAPLSFITRAQTRKQLQQAGIKLPFLGEHQLENVGLVMETIRLLKEQNLINLNRSTFQKGLRNVTLPGRIELISRNPLVILDSAHNPVSIRALQDTITKTFLSQPKRPKIILVFSIARDKEIQKIIDILLPVVSIILFTQAPNPRMSKPQELLGYLKHPAKPLMVCLETNPVKAFALAVQLAEPKDVVVVTGSFSLSGAIRTFLTNHKYLPKYGRSNP